MSSYDDETLMRWSDRELSRDAAESLEAAARSDPALAARMEAMGRTRQALARAFPVAFDLRDADLARRIGASKSPLANPRPLPGLRARLSDLFAPRHAVPWAAFAAAAFIGGLLLGPLTAGDAGLTLGAKGTVSDAGLASVLDRRLASQGPDDRGRSIGLTFQDVDGRWCRTFASGQERLGGLACRSDGSWTIVVVAPLERAGGEYRTASSDLPGAVLAAVDESIAGTTVDATGEAQARAAGWSRPTSRPQQRSR